MKRGDFLKKTPVIAINLKSIRIPIIIFSFVTVVYSSIILSASLPAVDLSDDSVRMLLSSNIAFQSEPLSCVGAYSLLKTKDGLTSASSQNLSSNKKDEIEKISIPAISNTNSEVKVSNSTDLNINPNDYLSPLPSFLKEDFSVLIIHTHTTESYTPSEKYNYTPTDTDRTTDKSFNMVKVGEEIEKVLSSQGIKVYRDTTMNDYPSYSGSYNKSAISIKNYIKNDPSIKIVLDVHRDAVVGKDGQKVKYSTEIDGKSASKIMFVVGSDLSGLKHDTWQENMQFASQLQKHTLSLYPTLCRPINFRSQRFNQQLAPGGIIVEVGTNGNTLDEAIYGARCFAIALADFIKQA